MILILIRHIATVGLKIFKNFQDGYYSEDEYNKGAVSTLINLIRDEHYIYPALKHLGCGHRKYFKNELIVSVLKKIFGNAYNIIPKKVIFTYAKLGIYQPLYCKVCGELLLYPNYSMDHCNNITCKETYNLNEKDYFSFLNSIFNSPKIKYPGHHLNAILKANENIKKYVYNYLLKYFDLNTIENMSANQKIYHILYDVKKIPLCKECGKKHVKFHEGLRCYKTTCSRLCNNHFIENIEKRLKNNQMHTNTGKNEYKIINKLYPNNNFKKEKLGPFFPDFIDYNNKILYEINETYHFTDKKIKADIRKYKYYKSKGWKIYIIFDFLTVKFSNHYKEKVRKWLEIFNDIITDFKVYDGVIDKPLILTKDGWSEFDGIVKFSNKETYEVTIDSNKRVRCTSDHLILNDENAFVEAETYKLSDKKVEDVYDVINVKNGNSFIVNDNITVHNCVILDEFAFLEPSCFDGDTPITLKNAETGEIIETTVEKAKALIEENE